MMFLIDNKYNFKIKIRNNPESYPQVGLQAGATISQYLNIML